MDRKWPKAVIFDMDGLMFASEQMIQRSWDEVGPELGYEPLGYHIFQTMGMNRASREQYFLGVYGEGFPYERFQDAYREKVRGYADREGVPVQKGLKSLLAYLKEEGIPMMVATGSSRAHALNYLERTGVLGYFRFVLAGDQVQVAKPDPEIYLKACGRLGVEPENAYAVEDSFNGVRSATRAGLSCIMVPDIKQPDDEMRSLACCILPSLVEVKEYLKIAR